jgi:hypothetical protein
MATTPGWWEVIWRDIQARTSRSPVTVVLDEIIQRLRGAGKS